MTTLSERTKLTVTSPPKRTTAAETAAAHTNTTLVTLREGDEYIGTVRYVNAKTIAVPCKFVAF